jgi:hypothetical protein
LPQSRNNLPDDLQLVLWVGRLLCLDGTVSRLAACAAERVDRRQPRSLELVPCLELGRYRRYDRGAVLGWLAGQCAGRWRKHQPKAPA